MTTRRLLLASFMGALCCGMAAADQPRTDPQAPTADKPDPTLTPRDMNEREQEYFAGLKKCEPLPDAERQDCVKALKAKYGVM